MTAERFRRLREKIGEQQEVARMLEVNVRTLRRWESGEAPVPKMAEYAVRWLVEKGANAP